MAEVSSRPSSQSSLAQPQSSPLQQNTGAVPPNHLGTNVPSGHLVSAANQNRHVDANTDAKMQDEKKEYDTGAQPQTHVPATKVEDDEDEDEDIDALIEDLESQDAAIDEEDDEIAQPGGERVIPEELLQTDTRHGLTSAEVLARRKKFGLNQMKGTLCPCCVFPRIAH
jgi:H+-transporting ATPase